MKVSWERSSRLPRWPLWAVVAVGVWAGMAGAAAALGPGAAAGHSACPFKEVTGVPCPSCGAGRAATALGRGRVIEAIVLNPLLTAAGGAMMLWLLARLAAGRRLKVALSRRERLAAAVAGVAALAANWIFLICQGR